MSRELTRATRIETLRKEAKRWLKALRAADPAARGRLAEALASPPPEADQKLISFSDLRASGPTLAAPAPR